MSMDILPTICKAAGAQLPTAYSIDGADMLPLVSSSAKTRHEAIFWTQGPQLAVRRGSWKLVMHGFDADGSPSGNKPIEGEDALFLSDVSTDPGERKNLRRVHPDLVDELATLAEKWKAGLQEPPR